MTLSKKYGVIGFLLISVEAFSQTDSLQKYLKVTLYVETYFQKQWPNGIDNSRSDYVYSFNRLNEVNLNLGFVKAQFDNNKTRANFGLMAGTYAQANLANEPAALRNIWEANVGFKLLKNRNTWLDMGVLPSHIGFESAISIENWNLTRSILAENSPYYLSGAKLTYNPSSKWELAALVCNGWQHIQRLPGNSLLSMGTQIKFTPNKKTTLNWSTFMGTDDPDSTRRMRYFNNFYGQFQLSKKFGFIAGFDIGIQQKIKNSAQYDAWFSPVIIARYAFNKKWTTAIRGEYYQDATGIIIPTNTPNGFKTTGFSINLDHAPTENLLCRFEARWLNSRDQLFQQSSNLLNNNFFMVSSVALRC